jgi:hypothetical protein
VRSPRASVAVRAEKRQMMMWESLREALDEEMERDPTVCMMGALSSSITLPFCLLALVLVCKHLV